MEKKGRDTSAVGRRVRRRLGWATLALSLVASSGVARGQAEGATEEEDDRPKIRADYSAQKQWDQVEPEDARGVWEKERDKELLLHLERVATFDALEESLGKRELKRYQSRIDEVRRLEADRHSRALRTILRRANRGEAHPDPEALEAVPRLKAMHEQFLASLSRDSSALFSDLDRIRSEVHKERKSLLRQEEDAASGR